MTALSRFGVVLIFSSAVLAQNRGGFVSPPPFLQGSFGNVVFPGGTSGQLGVQRTFGNILFPGGGGPQLIVPGSVNDSTFLGRPGGAGNGVFHGAPGSSVSTRGRNRNSVAVPYAIPIFIGGGFYDNPYVGEAGTAPQPQQPNITIVYPPVQQPVTLSPYGGGEGVGTVAPSPVIESAAEGTPTEPEHYLIAFKDRTIYAAVAYWVDGDTLHYFTTGNTHNQASVSLVDRELTERLNKDSGSEVRLP